MGNKTQTIEVDEPVAAALRARATERGVSVAEVIAELVPLAVDNEALAELDRRWDAVKGGQTTVPHDQVESWLKTWGSSDFRRWNDK